MTGPEHYTAAEQLLAVALGAGHQLVEVLEGAKKSVETLALLTEPFAALAVMVAQAQVHATLAVAAATIEPAMTRWDDVDAGRAWAEVAG